MTGYIDSYNFAELSCMKYWQPPAAWTIEKRKTETHKRIFSGEWLGARKMDGALYVFIKDEDGNIILRGRSKSVSGVYLDKWDHLPHLHRWANSIPNGTCLLGEVYWPGHEGSNNTTSIMNCLTDKAIARQDKDENKMHYYVFDILAWDGKSWLNEKARTRFEYLHTLEDGFISNYVHYAMYFSGEALWNELQTILADGGEGIVITHQDAFYEPDKRPSKTTLKIKKELKETIDCFFTGRASAPTKLYSGKEIETWPYWINEITNELLPIKSHYYESAIEGKPYTAITKPYYNGWAGSLEIGLYDESTDSVISLGYISGLTDEIKANYREYKNRVIEVGAMQLTPDGDRLRHGKMLGWRPDKIWKDCSIAQLKEL